MCGSTVRVPRLQPPAYGSSKVVGAVQQRAEEHDHRAGTAGGGLVDRGRGRARAGGMISRSLSALSQRVWTPRLLEHLEQPVDLLDAGDLAQRGPAAVEQRGAQQRDAGVLGGLDVDRAGQRRRAGHPQVGRAGAERDDLGVEGGADAGEHLQGEVLVALLDPVDRALAGAEQLGQLLLGQPAVLAGVADEVADPALVVLSHAGHGISDMR